MKALILYIVFVVIGGAGAVLIGLFTEREFNNGVSLVVFLALFFANFVVSWIGVILVMDGSLKSARGHDEQIEIERRARAAMAK